MARLHAVGNRRNPACLIKFRARRFTRESYRDHFYILLSSCGSANFFLKRTADSPATKQAHRSMLGTRQVQRRYTSAAHVTAASHRDCARNTHLKAATTRAKNTDGHILYCLEQGAMQAYHAATRHVLHDWSRPIGPECSLRACSDAPVQAGSGRPHLALCLPWQGNIFACTAMKAQVVATNCRIQERTLNLRTHRSSCRVPRPRARARPARRPVRARRRRTEPAGRDVPAHQSDEQSWRPDNGTKRAQIGKASGYTHRSFRPDAVHHMYAPTAMHRPAVTHADTHRDKKETARRAAFPQPAGCFRRWWQVLGSNQRRLSRRFYRPLSFYPSQTR